MSKEDPKIAIVYATTGSHEEARKIASSLLESKLVACVNIIPKMHSIYRWKGKIEKGDECIMIAKTSNENVDAVIKKIKEMHSYELPCTLVIPVIGGLEDYLKYVSDETKG
jgi:periplasmic divalent cation tolerance protein